jgi:pentatricopeptide repeat protein
MAPTVHAYTAAMRAATEGGRWVEALEIWDDMQRAGCQPTGEESCQPEPCKSIAYAEHNSNEILLQLLTCR